MTDPAKTAEWIKQQKRQAWEKSSGRFRAVVRLDSSTQRWMYHLYFRRQTNQAGYGGTFESPQAARDAADRTLEKLRNNYGDEGDPRPAVIFVPTTEYSS